MLEWLTKLGHFTYHYWFIKRILERIQITEEVHGAKTGSFLSMGASVPVDLAFATLLNVGTFTNPEAFQILSWRDFNGGFIMHD